MIPSLSPRAIRLTTAILAFVLEGCASGGARTDALARLEREARRQPASVSALRSLGIAYHRAGRPEDARTTLERAQALAPSDGVIALYLGLGAEQRADWVAAREAYERYLVHGRTSRVRRQLRRRMAAIRARELTQLARAALADESRLASAASSPRTIAVLPLRYTGSDSTLRPLERGLADLMVTDLARSRALTVVERDRLQSLVEEMRLAEGGTVDAATAARSGRLVGAGRIVQGALSESADRRLRLDAAVVDVPTTTAVGSAGDDDRLDQIFALEKRIVFGVFDALGVTLTPAERTLVEERPTRSVAAFVAYSTGLLAMDRGDLDEADRQFGIALRLDPGFALAKQRAREIETARLGSTVTSIAIETALLGTPEGVLAGASQPGLGGGTIGDIAEGLNPGLNPEAGTGGTAPSKRDPASSASGTDNPSSTGRIVVIIRQPR